MSRIEVRNLTKKYGATVALNEVNISFENEKIYGLLGRNGAGKTTLFSIISNRLFPDTGEVFIENKSITNTPNILKQIYCTTEKNLFPGNMKVKHLFKWTSEFFKDFDKERAFELCEIFNLEPDERIAALSTGYCSIIKNIVAISVNTPVLLLDEPVLGLDANHRDMFYKQLLKSYAQKPRTIVISTHLIEEIDGVIEKVIILDGGKIIVDDDADNFTQKGYMVSGPKNIVEEFIKGKNVIGNDMLGGLQTTYIFNEKNPDEYAEHKILKISKLPLQKLFIHLTNGGKKK